jgi:hypothetical protein
LDLSIQAEQAEQLLQANKGGEMVTLTIDLQEGFRDDKVVLYVNDKEVYRKNQVRTKRLLGMAASFTAEVETGPVNVEIRVETQDLAETLPLQVSSDTYLGISVVNGMIDSIVSEEPFGYG